MKGVILGICPSALLVDLTHQVSPQDIQEGAFQLVGACRWFPEGTVHLAVVDPGVGSSRRGIAARGKRFFYVGPDNGLLSLAWDQDEPVEVRQIEHHTLKKLSRTFHGRDMFAPVAAALASGVPLAEIGTPVTDPVHLAADETPRIVHIDNFGNLITNVRRASEPDLESVSVNWRTAPLRETFSGVAEGEILSYWGSLGLLEIAINGGNAAESTGIERGSEVRLHRAGKEAGGTNGA
jgi:S-adenosylmethionine hydrolase